MRLTLLTPLAGSTEIEIDVLPAPSTCAPPGTVPPAGNDLRVGLREQLLLLPGGAAKRYRADTAAAVRRAIRSSVARDITAGDRDGLRRAFHSTG